MHHVAGCLVAVQQGGIRVVARHQLEGLLVAVQRTLILFLCEKSVALLLQLEERVGTRGHGGLQEAGGAQMGSPIVFYVLRFDEKAFGRRIEAGPARFPGKCVASWMHAFRNVVPR